MILQEIGFIKYPFALLGNDYRKLVVDFVTFLKNCNPKTVPAEKKRKIKLADEPFIGMWRDREDMRDSTGWVRDLRRREWGLER